MIADNILLAVLLVEVSWYGVFHVRRFQVLRRCMVIMEMRTLLSTGHKECTNRMTTHAAATAADVKAAP